MNISISTYVPLNPKTTFHGTDFYGNSTNEGNTSGFICSSASPIGNLLNCLHVSLSNPAIGGLLHTGKAQRERFAKTLILHSSSTGNDPRKGWRIPLNEIKYNEQRDEETGYGYFGARYYDADLLTGWLSVDPMSDKYPSITPYAYCVWNPVKIVDPEGEDTLLFDKNGKYQKTLPNGKNIGLMQDRSGKYSITFEFADDRWCDRFTNLDDDELMILNQNNSTDNLCYNKVVFADDKFIEDQLDKSGVNGTILKNVPQVVKVIFAASQSRGQNKHLDFVNYTSVQNAVPRGGLIITMGKDRYLAHDSFNFGNFLWGAAMGRMRISPLLVLCGANLDAKANTGEWDSPDDQRSIWAGYKYGIR